MKENKKGCVGGFKERDGKGKCYSIKISKNKIVSNAIVLSEN